MGEEEEDDGALGGESGLQLFIFLRLSCVR